MAIAKLENVQIQQQNGIVQTANLNTGSTLAASTSQVGNIVKNFGNQLLSQSSQKVAEERAADDIKKQQELLAKGESGDFNHVGSIVEFLNPAYGKTYNNLIDQVAVPNYTAQYNKHISEVAQQIKMDPNIPVEQKTQALSSEINKAIPQALENVPEEFRYKVAQMGYNQSTQELARMMQFSANVQSKQLEYASYNNMENLAILGRKSITLEDANNYQNQIQQLVEAGLNSGMFSPQQATSLKENYKSDILGHFAVNAGIHNIKQWNEQNGSPLDENTVDQMQAFAASQYVKEENRREQEQLQNGYSFELQMAKVMNGYSATPPSGGYTDRQWASMQKAMFVASERAAAVRAGQTEALNEMKVTGSLYNAFKDMNAEDRLNLQVGNFDKLNPKYNPYVELFLKQPTKMQNYVLSKVKEHTTNIQAMPITALELTRPNFDSAFAAIQNKQPIPDDGFDVDNRYATLAQQIGTQNAGKNIIDNREVEALMNMAQIDRGATDQYISMKYKQFTPTVRAKVFQAMPKEAKGYTLINTPGVNPNLKQAYLNADPSTNINKQNWINTKNIGSTYFEGLKNLHPDSADQVVSFVNKVVAGSKGTIQPKEVLDNLFDKGDMLRAKGDSEYLDSKAVKEVLAKKGIYNTDALTYYPDTDTYRATNTKGESFKISGSNLRNPTFLNNTFTEKIGKKIRNSKSASGVFFGSVLPSDNKPDQNQEAVNPIAQEALDSE